MNDKVEAYIRHCVREDVLQAESYQTNPLAEYAIDSKLDAMESPYNLLPQHLKRIHGELQSLELNRYPQGDAGGMLQGIREYFAIPEQYGILPGNGSDELIQIIATAMSGSGACALAAEPTFSMYQRLCTMAQLEYIPVPLQAESLELDLDAMWAAIKKHKPGVVWIANPNNPTGIDCGQRALQEIADIAPGVVVVDEAYNPYAEGSILDRPLPPNVLVLRTLSKIGFAGLRIGILIADKQWIQQLDKVRLPYNISTTSQSFAMAMLSDAHSVNNRLELICDAREQVRGELEKLNYRVWPSATNFLLVKVGDAMQTHKKLAEHGIAIKNMHNSHELLRNCVRITIGNPKQNEELLQVLQSI